MVKEVMKFDPPCNTDPFFERLSKNTDLESGLRRIEEDPVIRQLATAVLEECERVRQQQSNKKMSAKIVVGFGLFIMFIISLYNLISKMH